MYRYIRGKVQKIQKHNLDHAVVEQEEERMTKISSSRVSGSNVHGEAGISSRRYFVQGLRFGFFKVGRAAGNLVNREMEEARREKLEKATGHEMLKVDDIYHR